MISKRIYLFLFIALSLNGFAEVNIDSYLYSDNSLFSTCDYYSFSSDSAYSSFSYPVNKIEYEKGMISKEQGYILDHEGKTIKEKINRGIYKQCFTFEREKTLNGYSISFDYIPTWYGKEYKEYKWINNTYQIRKELNFSQNNNDNVFYYNVSYNALMNADFSDIRFANENNTAELPYYIFSKKDSSSVIFAIKLSGTKMYMYYGNPSITNSGSNCTNVFAICDNTLMSSIPTTLLTSSAGGGGINKLSSNIINISSKTTGSNTAILRSASVLPSTYRVRIEWNLSADDNFLHVNIMDSSYTGGTNSDYDSHTIVSIGQTTDGKIDFFIWNNSNGLQDWNAVSNVWVPPLSANMIAGTLGIKYIFEIQKDANNFMFTVRDQQNNIIEQGNRTVASVRSGDNYLAIGDLANDARYGTIFISNLTVEKYLSNSILTESSPLGIPSFSISISTSNNTDTYNNNENISYSISGNTNDALCNLSVNSSLYSSNNLIYNNSLSNIQLNKSVGTYYYQFLCQKEDISNSSQTFTINFLTTTTTTTTTIIPTTTTTTTIIPTTTTTILTTTTNLNTFKIKFIDNTFQNTLYCCINNTCQEIRSNDNLSLSNDSVCFEHEILKDSDFISLIWANRVKIVMVIILLSILAIIIFRR